MESTVLEYEGPRRSSVDPRSHEADGSILERVEEGGEETGTGLDPLSEDEDQVAGEAAGGLEQHGGRITRGPPRADEGDLRPVLGEPGL